MAENYLRLETGIFGLAGYQASNAQNPDAATAPPPSAVYLKGQRPKQIGFLEAMIKKTRQPQVRARLERALKPWVLWNKEPRFWAFPDFAEPKHGP
jgi:hypothetical protein